MPNIDILKKKILYRCKHRGTKEMDLLLSNFVDKYINTFSEEELFELEKLLNIDDEILYKWYSHQNVDAVIPNNIITEKLKKFKI